MNGESLNNREQDVSCKNPCTDEKVVITGISGTFPDAMNVSSFRDNLFNKVDLVTPDNTRWNATYSMPKRHGKILDVEKFDLGFFGVSSCQCDSMDPSVRKVLEKAIEAVMDAGYHPLDLANTNTAVINGLTSGETERNVFFENQIHSSDPLTGAQRSMTSKRISYYLKLNASSYIIDTACCSSLHALEQGYVMIKSGLCSKAIVCSTNLCLQPMSTLQASRLGILSQDGTCRSFDDSASGYVRSDAIVVMLLERKEDAKRIYTEVIHAKTNCDGYKETGINHPSSEFQGVLMKELYNECKIDPNSLIFIEGHGTGTQVGDFEELTAIDNILCKGRKTPLHIGSVKSNIGHTEAASGLCSVTKVIISMETGYIPPNIHYKTPRKVLEALQKGRLVVPTEKLPLSSNQGLFAVNSLGFGGVNVHALFFRNTKIKINNGQPKDDLLRLLCVSSRVEEGVNAILNDFKKCDAEYAYLIQQVFRKRIENHLYRGFGIYSKEGEMKRSLAKVGIKEKQLYLVFSNYDKEFLKFGSQFMNLPIFAKTIESIHDILFKAAGIYLLEIIRNPMEESLIKQILIAAATQISLANILKEINLKPYGVVGVGTGEVVAAYAEGHLPLEQTIETLLYIASDISNSSNINEKILDKIKRLREKVNEQRTSIYKEELGQSLANHFADNIVNTMKKPDLKNLLIKDAVPLIIGTSIEDLSGIKKIYLADPNSNDLFQDFLITLGCLYEQGFDMQVDKLYPSIELPVSRGTPMLSPLIKWNFTRDCMTYFLQHETQAKTGYKMTCVSPKAEEWNFINGYVVDGGKMLPATGYLYLVWESFAEITDKDLSTMKIVFEEVKFLRATNLPNEDAVEILVMIQTGSHIFEISEGGGVIVTGKIFEKSNEQSLSNFETQLFKSQDLCMNQTDIYKELHLRGYNLRNSKFKSIQKSTVDFSKAVIEWNGNWITFMDSLLQIVFLQQDTRDLYLPIFIYQLVIDVPEHLNIVGNQTIVEVYADKSLEIVKAGGVELKSLKVTHIPRKMPRNPLLEVYRFTANEIECGVDDSLRILVQFILENSDTFKFKIVEICSEEMEQEQLLCPLMQKTLEDMPLVQEEMLVLSNKAMTLSNITVKNKSLKIGVDCFILIVSSVLETVELFEALNAIKRMKGFIISREKPNADLSKFTDTPLDVLCSHKTNEEILVLLKPIQRSLKEPLTIDISNAIGDFQWIPKLQDFLMKNDRIIVYTQGDQTSGILGLVNCLKKEYYGDKLSTVFIMDEAPKFDPNLDFYKKQLDKNLLINVWKDGTWGTYKHLQLPQTQVVQREHCFASITTRGDLPTMTWFEGSLNEDSHLVSEKELIHIYYSALNVCDLIIASENILPDIVTKNRIEPECTHGVEFSGRDTKGRRVMGICQRGSLATLVQCDKYLIYPIPDDWTLEDAATVPVAYTKAIQAFKLISQSGPGQSILINSGTDGVGQAAINLSLHFGLTVFVTVGTQEKRDFIKQHYPKIKEEHIGNSRDTSFESMIRRHTNGRGVDYVLNSLVEEKLLASVRCLAKRGKFIEIEKSDMVNNNEFVSHLLEKEVHFISLAADKLILTANSSENEVYYDKFMELIKEGVIKPLPRVVFSTGEVEKAFQYIKQEKYIGKVLIKIRDEERQEKIPVSQSLFEGLPRFYCNLTRSYLIHGGLGGFGLELADFLVVRGARKLVLSSRSGISNGYQKYRMSIWKSYGAEVVISTCNVSTEEDCTKLLKIANEMGSVDGIFNLAVVLKDAMFNNQTIDDFKTVFSPKVFNTKHLDRISRELCPNLRFFVLFSSYTAGRGNAGQTNYGMANSVMERVCEKRRREGYPALVVQFGPVGSVGLISKTPEDDNDDEVILGTLRQSISNCLQVLDMFLTQTETVVSSTLMMKKKYDQKASNIVGIILSIIGVTNINTISMHSTLPELGMDSRMVVEIKQTLEKEYEICLAEEDIRGMTFSKLKSLSDAQEIETEVNVVNGEDIPLNINLLFRYIGREENINMPVLKLKTLVDDGENAPHIFALPGLEGTSTSLEAFCKKLKAHVSCLQFCREDNSETVSKTAESLLPYVLSFNGDLIILAYSFGCVIATELLHLLALKNRRVKVIYIDGSPDLFMDLLTQYLPINGENFQLTLLALLMTPYMTYGDVMRHKNNILQNKDFKEKLDYVVSLLHRGKISRYFKEICVSTYKRIVALYEYKPKMDKLKFPITLFKATEGILMAASSDYNLSGLFENHIDISSVEGTHVTMLENDDLSSAINKICRKGW